MTPGKADGCKMWEATFDKDPRKAQTEGRSRQEEDIKGLGNGCGGQGAKKEAEGIRSIWLENPSGNGG